MAAGLYRIQPFRGTVNENEAILAFVDEYSRNAEAYDANVVPRFRPFAEKLVAQAALKPHATVLDVSTGTGLTAILAAKAMAGTGLVVGIDLADGALAVAQTNAARANLRNLRFEMLDARNIVYRSGTFDTALSSFGLSAVGHEQTLREIHRVLKDGASFHLVTWGPPGPGGTTWREALAKHRAGTPSAALAAVREADAMIRGIAESAGLTDPSVVPAKMRAAGFADVRAEPESGATVFATLDDYVAWWMGFGDHERELQEMNDGARSVFRRDLEERLAGFRGDDGFRVPWNVVYYRARK